MTRAAYYSANPLFASHVAEKYRSGTYFAWICEYFDSERDAPPGALIAPNSNPRKIYEDLFQEYVAQEEHPKVIRDHRRKFRALARGWKSDGTITADQCDEIISSVNARSWTIWKPIMYVIPRGAIDASRIISVPRPGRGGYGAEYQIKDLQRSEFDILDLSDMRLRR